MGFVLAVLSPVGLLAVMVVDRLLLAANTLAFVLVMLGCVAATTLIVRRLMRRLQRDRH